MIKKITCLLILGFVLSLSGFGMTDTAQARRSSPAEKQARKDRKYTKFFEKKVKDVKRYMDMKSYTSAGRMIKNAKRYYGKISDTHKETPKVVKIKNKLDSLESKFNSIVQGQNTARNERENIRKLKYDFEYKLRPYKRILYFLYMGKVKKYSTNFSYKIEEYRKAYNTLDKLENLLNTKYAKLVSDSPKTKIRDVGTIAEIKDLVVNRKRYRDSTVNVICSTLMENRLSELNRVYSKLEKYGLIWVSWLDNFYGKDKNKDLPIIGRCQKIVSWINGSLPSDKVRKIRDFKPRMRQILEKTADKNDWNSSKYSYENRDMKKIAKLFAERKGMDLEEIAMTSKNDWKIVKNAFGVPLRKVGYGYALFKKSGEPFLRGYSVSFIRVYNGSRYEDISKINFSREIKPFDD